MASMRLDQALVLRGLSESREKAQRAILAGTVFINGQKASKSSDKVTAQDELSLSVPEKFVSRGGIKLEGALQAYGLDVAGLRCIDLGASTGGFTDCLLQQGAASVCAVDVGYGQLAWKLRQDLRVTVLDKTNARQLSPAHFPLPFQPFDLVVIDCSFISLSKILPAATGLARRPGGRILALIKPQFEAGKAEVDKGAGVIRDPAIHQKVLENISAVVADLPGWKASPFIESSLLGPAGNKEYFILMSSL